jgi:hypothetical protein
MKAGNYFTQLPTWAKGVLAVGGLAIVAFVGYKIYKKIQDQQGKGDEKDVINEVKQEERELIQQGLKPSFNDSVYESSANLIFQKLDGCEMSSSELDVMREVVRVCQNKLDWAKLVRAFGTRTVDNCGWGTGETAYSLPTLLKDQLDSTEVGGVNNGKRYYAILVGALDKRGIKI